VTDEAGLRRRSMDRDRWTDERMDDFARVTGPAAGMVAQHEGQIDALKDSLARMERDSKERFDRAFEKLDRITRHVERTNGRVTDLEKNKAVEEALRAAAASAVEERRKTLALHLAAHGWVRPTLAGGAMGLIVTALSKFA
jgi:hypothetical protein